MSEAPKAVFLSYAREDAEAAKRIAEALRAFGVEVWFDQNELRGGDTWDTNIRSQIKSCALFVPIISERTEERTEGYFRREWKLAVDRTHDMAGSRSFIVPVVIDQTSESGAAVPEEFMRYQWTRLADGAPTPEFVTQVKRLLEAPKKPALKTDHPKPPTLPPELKQGARSRGEAGSGDPSLQVKGMPGWAWGALVVVVVGIGVYLALRPAQVGPVSDRSHSDSPPPVAQASSLSPSKAADAKSIAVLPFANLSTDKENEFFADGVHDDVITNLAKIRDLKVISRTSVLAYRDTASRNLKKIAADLGVATVLEGSIRRVGNKVHMNAQLIDARTDEHLWAETFDGDTDDIFALQAKLAQQIASALKANLTAGEKALIERRPTEDPVAYEFFLRGRILQQGLSATASREQYDAIIALYEQAIARDPNLAFAHVNLSIVHGAMYWFGAIDPSPERRARAQKELEIAQRLVPDAPETGSARGAFAYLCENNWERALKEYGSAEAGLPNDARLQYLTAISFRRLGRWPEAMARFDRAVILNPNDLSGLTSQVETMLLLRRYAQVRELAARYLVRFPDSNLLNLDLIQANFALSGDQAGFVRALAALPRPPGDPDGTEDRYRQALRIGDLATAARVVADPSLTAVLNNNGAIKDPVALHRAGIALLQGDRATARKFADEAIHAYQTAHWSPRQEPLVRLGIARALALAGRTAEGVAGLATALQELRQWDKFLALASLTEAAETYAVIGRPEEALACLRELLAGPSIESPHELRANPFLASLRSDPRFEEILNSAKPL